jgi:hypothetical protein
MRHHYILERCESDDKNVYKSFYSDILKFECNGQILLKI